MTGAAIERSPLGALWDLARPRGAVWVGVLPLFGYGFAHWDRALLARSPEAVPIVFVAWILLHAGTMWLNAALDRDGGEVLYGRSVPVPDLAVPAGWAALIASVALASVAGPVPGLCALGCAALAVLYSHPRTAWKGHPWLGPATNALGYGFLSPLAGWWLAGVRGDPRTWVASALLVLWVLGCYFAAQAFQHDEDRARGYRTLVAVAGPARVLSAARLCLGASGGGFLALAVVGWFPRPSLLAVPVLVWALALLTPDRLSEPRWTDRAFGRLLVFGWALLLLVTAEYLRELALDVPVAGWGTAAGHPPLR